MDKIQALRDWNEVKIRIDQSGRTPFFNEGEIWWASLGINVGREQNGKNASFERPILVLKKFNKECLLAVPATSSEKEGFFYYSIHTNARKTVIILSQIRFMSSLRLLQKMGDISPLEFHQINKRIGAFFS